MTEATDIILYYNHKLNNNNNVNITSGEVDWKWRHAWLNYQGGQWLDGYPMIHSSWPDDTPSAMCVKFAVKGWIVRKCETKAATMLLCEDRSEYIELHLQRIYSEFVRCHIKNFRHLVQHILFVSFDIR